MNINMLRYLVELSNRQVDVININDFFAKYPDCGSTTDDLKALESYGYISLLFGDNHVCDIGVNQRGIDYIKKRS